MHFHITGNTVPKALWNTIGLGDRGTFTDDNGVIHPVMVVRVARKEHEVTHFQLRNDEDETFTFHIE